MVDIVTTIAQTGSQFLSTITVGGQQFLGAAVPLLAVFLNAVVAGFRM